MTNPLESRLQSHLGASHSIEFELGGGGMSRTFVANDKTLNRRVVVKVLHPTMAATVSIARFQREIMLAAKLQHPHIVPVISAGEVDGLPFFVMPYIEGESLRARIVRGPLSIRETVAILRDVGRALAYAHSSGIVHRDIKPDNILLAGTAAVVTDFGVAKALTAARERGKDSAPQGATITGVGISLGTPQYMAPEQASADPAADHRVDIYALGIVGYEMLVGAPPFHGRTPQALLAAQLTELPQPLAARRYDVPVALAEMVMKCLEKDPADRPRTASDIVRTLETSEAISGPVASTPRAQQTSFRKKLSARIGIGAFVVLLLTALAWPFVFKRDGSSTGGAAGASSVPIVTLTPFRSIGQDVGDIATGIATTIETALIRAGIARVSAVGAVDSTGYTLDATIQRDRDRVRATLRLSRVTPDSALWADQYDFEMKDQLAAQDSIARRVVEAVARIGR